MKCFVAVMFLVAVAVANRCTPHAKFSAEYFSGGALDADGPFIFTGKLMVDMAGRRLWESFNSITGGGKGETLYLFNEDKKYRSLNGSCVMMQQLNADEPWINMANELISQLPKDAKLLKSGNNAESNVKVNLYGGVREKGGSKVSYTITQTDRSCIIINAAYRIAETVTAKFDLFDVKMGIDEGKLVPPAGCKSPQGPQQPVADD